MPEFRRQFRGIKRTNKQRLADEVMRRTGVEISVDSLFDVQVKRIHEYKRQLLNLLYVVTRYRRIRENPRAPIVPRTVIFAGKAAPGYAMAKAIIKLINNVARTIDADIRVRDKLRWYFCRITTFRWRKKSCPRRIYRSKFPPPAWRRREPAI